MGLITVYNALAEPLINFTGGKQQLKDSLCECSTKLNSAEIDSTIRELTLCIETAIVLLLLILSVKFIQIYQMWFMMEQVQRTFSLSERLIRVINRSSSLVPPFSLMGDGNYITDSIEQLVKDGADVNALSGNVLPLHCACVEGDAKSVKTLLNYGAKVDNFDGYGRTALHYAAERSQHCVELLLQRGAQLSARDLNGCTPLHWAAYKNKATCLRALLDAGADPDAADVNGDTPLSFAALKGHLETVRVLLEFNADADVRNQSGKTPVDRLAETIAAGIGSAQDDTCLALLVGASGRLTPWPLRILPQSEREMGRRCAPPALLHLSRHAIRRNLRRGRVPALVDGLHVPQALKDFLALGVAVAT